MKPVLFYVDDEPHNLIVFEAACPDDWTVHTFESPLSALEKLDTLRPNVIVTDQRMPGMTGVQFLEIARKILPDSVRIIVTGYSDEDLVVQSVRKAQIFDYIKKPWEVDDLLASLGRANDFFMASQESRRLQEELKKRESELRDANASLTNAMKDLEISRLKEADVRAELECWVPPFVLWALRDSTPLHDTKRDIVGVAFDIISSSQLHSLRHVGRPIRSQIIQIFTEALLRNGGWRESHSGDSAYGHFGLLGQGPRATDSPSDCALAAAREFRASLRSLGLVTGHAVECGIALHIARECQVHIHTVQLNTPRGPVTQKSFDTTSGDVDLLHRMEKLAHRLPGSNIIMSKAFVETVKSLPPNVVEIGKYRFSGQKDPVELIVLTGDLVRPVDIEELKALAEIESDDSGKIAS